jgi:hypothetical protein
LFLGVHAGAPERCYNTTMTRILLLYYSQSGEAGRVAETLASSLLDPDVDLVMVRLRPRQEYPFPWRNVGRFFSILPQCHLGPLPELETPGFDPDQKYDLVIFVYQVWFLTPSLPVQAFLKSNYARVLRDTKVLTVSVSRNMWHWASEMMKRLLAETGARHIDNVAVTHQGPAWATFVTTPRALLLGKKDGFWGIFPPAGLDERELDRVTRFGKAILQRRDRLHQPEALPLLTGLGAVPIQSRYLLPELIGWYWFRGWAHLIRFLGRLGTVPRMAGVYLFVAFLLFMIVVVMPLTMLGRLLLFPLINKRLTAYVHRLEQPSEN